MTGRNYTQRTAEQLAERVSELGAEQISVRSHHTDSPRRYSIQRHNQYDDRLTSPLSFGPTFPLRRERFTAAEVTLILAGMVYGIEIANPAGTRPGTTGGGTR
jgi:hypothetical protein